MKFKNILLLVIFFILFHFFWNDAFSNWEERLEIPDFKYELQSPSYIEETWSW